MRFERAVLIWTRSADSIRARGDFEWPHYEAGQMTAPDHTLSTPEILLALAGASTDGILMGVHGGSPERGLASQPPASRNQFP